MPGEQIATLSGKSQSRVIAEYDHEGIPQLRFPDPFNVAECFVDRHLPEGRGRKAALRLLEQEVTYAELFEKVNRYGNALKGLPIGRGERLLMVVKDCPEFFFLFWGAIKAGVIPVPLNTLLRARDYEFILGDSGCAGLVYSSEFASEVEIALAASSRPPGVILRLNGGDDALSALAREASPELGATPARAEDDCFWLYSSGTTGQPKGVVHAHGSIVVTCWHFAMKTLGAGEGDVFFSVPRLFFSYGLSCAMTFPLWVGGTAVLDERRPTPQTVRQIFRRCAPSIFAAVPSFYAAILAAEVLDKSDLLALRRCLSGGEATPPEVQRRWLQRTGVPIMEVLGSTEMLSIYLANRLDHPRPGTTGLPVRGYQARIVDDAGQDVDGEGCGRMFVAGQSMMKRYWNNPAKTAATIVDGWMDTGDVFIRDSEGHYVYCGRNDDMLKVGGRWVSPFEIESALVEHPKVVEATVVGRGDEDGFVRVQAWIVLRDPADASDLIAEEIRAFCKSRLAPYKYPRWIHFVAELPKTATGKIQRFKLRISPQNSAGHHRDG